MNTIGRAVVVVAVVAVAFGAWWRLGCLLPSSLSATLSAKAESRQPFSLRDIAEFEWDRVVLLGPYTDRATAERALQIGWPEYALLGLQSSDSFNLIVLAKGSRVVQAQKLMRCLPDFDPGILAKSISRAEANFHFVSRSGCVTIVNP